MQEKINATLHKFKLTGIQVYSTLLLSCCYKTVYLLIPVSLNDHLLYEKKIQMTINRSTKIKKKKRRHINLPSGGGPMYRSETAQ